MSHSWINESLQEQKWISDIWYSDILTDVQQWFRPPFHNDGVSRGGIGPCPKRLLCYEASPETCSWQVALAMSKAPCPCRSIDLWRKLQKMWHLRFGWNHLPQFEQSCETCNLFIKFHHERVATSSSSSDKAQRSIACNLLTGQFRFSSLVLDTIWNYCNQWFLSFNQAKAQNVCQSASPFTGTPANQPRIGDTQNCRVMNGVQAHQAKW